MVCVMDYWPTVHSEYSENACFEDSRFCVQFFSTCTVSPVKFFSFRRYLNHAEAERAAQLDFSYV